MLAGTISAILKAVASQPKSVIMLREWHYSEEIRDKLEELKPRVDEWSKSKLQKEDSKYFMRTTIYNDVQRQTCCLPSRSFPRSGGVATQKKGSGADEDAEW